MSWLITTKDSDSHERISLKTFAWSSLGISRGERISGNTKCAVLKDLVTNKLLVAKAEIDSVIVEDNQVDQELNSRMALIINQIGSEEEIEKYYNKTIAEFKRELFDDIKEQLVMRKMRQEILGDIEVSPEEVKEFYATIPRDSLPYFSTQVKVSQIVKIPEIGREQKNKTREELLKIRERILNGESFEILATLYSQDPGSAQNGGNLGFVGRGAFQPEFEAEVFKLKPGEISMPIETEFGYHLIELIEKRGNLFNSRHILLQPEFSSNDIKKTINFLDSLKNIAYSDSVTFEELARKHSDLVNFAFVATTPIVVFSNGLTLGMLNCPSLILFGYSPKSISPLALTAIRQETIKSPSRSVAPPSPPSSENSLPLHFDTVAPVPAPTRPNGAIEDATEAASFPSWCPGRTVEEPLPRSNNESPTTIGTFPADVLNPIFASSRNSITPEQADNPKADPPDKTTALI